MVCGTLTESRSTPVRCLSCVMSWSNCFCTRFTVSCSLATLRLSWSMLRCKAPAFDLYSSMLALISAMETVPSFCCMLLSVPSVSIFRRWLCIVSSSLASCNCRLYSSKESCSFLMRALSSLGVMKSLENSEAEMRTPLAVTFRLLTSMSGLNPLMMTS